MEKNTKNYMKLFKSTFFISAFCFGGGYIMIPLMKKRFVDELGWLEEEEMLDMITIAQSSPGAMAVNASVLVGRRHMGMPGALVAVLGTVLPPFIILSIVSAFYMAFRNNTVVNAVFKGMMAGVCAVIIDVVITMGGGIIRERKPLPIIMMAAAFVAYYVLGINTVYIILFCGMLGALVSLHDKKSGKEHI